MAGLAVGFWSETHVAELAGTDRVFQPTLGAVEREDLYHEWQRAAERALSWAREP